MESWRDAAHAGWDCECAATSSFGTAIGCDGVRVNSKVCRDQLKEAGGDGTLLAKGLTIAQAMPFQQMLSQINDLWAPKLRQRTVYQLEACRGQEDLASMADVLHSLCQCDRRPSVAPPPCHLMFGHRGRSATVNTHSHAKPSPGAIIADASFTVAKRSRRPLHLHELGLHFEAEADGVQRLVERHLERVPLRRDLIAIVGGEHLPNLGIVQPQCLLHRCRIGLPEVGRTLHIGEDHGDFFTSLRRTVLHGKHAAFAALDHLVRLVRHRRD
mmetsp:Transcript_52133/g.134464  ORF Transcript_52133/g.134464 Transcript_52133/m.134464 type:complete len:271 (-) Transcript_52133:213-1025(-)